MIKDALIKIKGVQGIDNDTDTIEFSTEGKFGIKNGEFYISYSEGQMFDSGGIVKTVLFIKKDNSVLLERSGALNSKMLIEKGQRNSSFYAMAQGELIISIYGEKIQHNLNENGGSIFLAYTIDSNMQLLSRNTVEITISEVK